MRAHSRRENAPSAELLRERLVGASLSAWRTRLVEHGVRALRTLPPLIFVPGHSPSHEQKCLTLAKRLRSGPISERIVITVVTDRPLMRVRSTPAQRATAARASNCGAFLLRRLPGPSSVTS